MGYIKKALWNMYAMGVRDIGGDHCWFLVVARQCVDVLGAVKMTRMILADVKPRAPEL
jgi:hypothetical protein